MKMPGFFLLPITLISIFSNTAVAQAPQRTTATYGDWTVRCTLDGKTKTCEMAQSVQIKGRAQPITQIAIGRRTKNGPLKIVFGVPVNVWLPNGVELVTSKKEADVKARFSRCIPTGCFAEADIDATGIKQLSQIKNNGKLQFKDARLQQVAIPVSFKGFGDAFEALQK